MVPMVAGNALKDLPGECPRRASHRTLAGKGSIHAAEQCDCAEEQRDATEADQVLTKRRRENKDVARVLHQSGETRHTEGHEKEAEDLPAIELCRPIRR